MQNKWAQGMQLETYVTHSRVLFEAAIIVFNDDSSKTPYEDRNTLIEQSAVVQTTLIEYSCPHLETRFVKY